MTILRAHASTHRGEVIYLEAVRWPVNCFTRSRHPSISYFLASLGAQENSDNAHILDINVVINCQNRVSADQHHLTVSRAQVSTHRGKVFFEVIRWQDTSFQMIAGSSLFFLKNHMKFVLLMFRTTKILILNWPRTPKFSQLLQAGKTVPFDFAHHGHALVTLYIQFLCSDWSKFDRWVHAENLCSILNLVYFDSWSWQSFVSTCDVLTIFFHWMFKMKFSCYQESSVIHG